MNTKIRNSIITVAVGVLIWMIPVPGGLKQQAWNVLAVVVATIVGFILHPVPIGAIAFISISLTACLGVLDLKQVLSGFSNDALWLIVAAFFFARGFIKTGLGRRIAYGIVYAIGSSSLRVGYALAISDLVLAITTPSSTARAGGILYPIIRSLNSVYDSEPGPTARRVGAYFLMTVYQSEAITCAMFLTAMAGNPFMVDVAAKSFGITVTWGLWALAASVPGVLSMLVMPYFLYKIFPPEIDKTPEARQKAARELAALGPMSAAEKVLLGVLVSTIILWSTAQYHSIGATLVAMCAVSAMIIGQVLQWRDIVREEGAWDTFIWMGSLITLAGQLTTTGFIPWFAQVVAGSLTGLDWKVTLLALLLVYMYSHYFFASATAHIISMYAVFLAVGLAAGGPPLVVAISLAFVANNCLALTHYSAGAAPIYFGAGYIDLGTWWRLGFLVSLVNLVIWFGVGAMWWKVIGLW